MISIDRTEEVKAMIIEAIRDNARYTDNAWVSMGAVRETIRATRVEFDEIMGMLALAQTVVCIPEENQQTLTDVDRYNAIIVRGVPCHVVSLA